MLNKLFYIIVLICFAFSTHAQKQDSAYIFSYFRGNGEDGLHLAYSEDGLKWAPLKNDQSFLSPKLSTDKLMRDPCIIKGPDGLFHMVWTVSWTQKGIGYASSKDLINWSEQLYIPVMEHEENARNTWAPEITYDPVTKQYMIYWATTITGEFPETQVEADNGYNHRMYYTLTKDFKTFTETMLLYEPGFNCIDATIQKNADKWMMGMLHSLGIEQGKPFNPDAKTKKAMEDAVGDLYIYLQKLWDVEAAKKMIWNDRHYTSLMLIDSKRSFFYDEGRYIDIDRRFAQWATATVLPRQLSERPATDYLMSLADKTGEPLKAGVNYKVTVPAKMPVQQFWALTVYDHATFAFIYNDLNRTTLSSYDLKKMAKNKDGSVTLYVGPDVPKDAKGKSLESNWIPTVGKRPIPTFRFYSPTEDVYNGKFKMPDFEVAK